MVIGVSVGLGGCPFTAGFSLLIGGGIFYGGVKIFQYAHYGDEEEQANKKAREEGFYDAEDKEHQKMKEKVLRRREFNKRKGK